MDLPSALATLNVLIYVAGRISTVHASYVVKLTKKVDAPMRRRDFSTQQTHSRTTGRHLPLPALQPVEPQLPLNVTDGLDAAASSVK